MRSAIVRTSILLALLAVGCGAAADSSSEFSGEEQRVAAVVEDLEDAAADDEQRRICRQLFAAELARRAGDCIDTVARALDESDNDDLAVESVRVNGDRARARVATGTDEDQKVTFELVRENDRWRIAGLGG